MANLEQMALLKAGSEEWNQWRSRKRQTHIDLSGANLTGLDLSQINLKDADLTQAILVGADLTEASLRRADLRDAQLNYAKLRGAKLTGTNLRGAQLQNADLSFAQMMDANLSDANLTGACLDSWNTNSQTDLSKAQAGYIYLKHRWNPNHKSQQRGVQGGFEFLERRPHSGHFRPGEFATLYQQVLDTLDLIFIDGIDWQAFFNSFQELQCQYQDAELSIQAIERKPAGNFVIRLDVSTDADKAEIQQSAIANYEGQIQLLEERYQGKLQAKDIEISSYKREVESYRQQSANMTEIARTLADRSSYTNPVINVEAKAISSSDQFTNTLEGETINNFTNYLSNKANQPTTIINGNHASVAETVELADDARTIIFLASNPKQTGRLRLDQELRELDESLRRAQRRSQFKLENKGALRPRDFTRALLDTNPQIVHFSGHGKGTAKPDLTRTDARDISFDSETDTPVPQGLLFENETGHAKLIGSKQLAGVFKLFADRIECVLLNACYSQNQADAIAQHIPYVIGMSHPISDKGAIEFAIAFYDAIGAGRDIPFAFELACTQLIDSGEEDIPQLIQKPSVSA